MEAEVHVLESWDRFFSTIVTVIRECSAENIPRDPDNRTVSYAVSRIENCVSGIRRVGDHLASVRSELEDHPLSHLVSKIQLLLAFFSSLHARWRQVEVQLCRTSSCPFPTIQHLRSLGFS